MMQHPVTDKKITRRAFLSGLAACGAAVCLTACGGTSASSSGASSPAVPSEPTQPVPQETSVPPETPAEPFLTLEEYPPVDGSTACIPLMAQLMADSTGYDLEAAQTGISVSTTAYAWLRMGAWNDMDDGLLLVYEAPDYVQEILAEEGSELDVKAIGRDALVFLVNETNPVQSLTRQQLLDIYAGRITNWKELGGEDAEIIPFQRSEDSGSQTLFRKLLIGDNELMEAPTELTPTEMGALIDDVANYNNSGNALGFSVYYYVDQMVQKQGLRLLAVDDVVPCNETIANQSYPLCNDFFAVIPAQAEPDSPARQLYDWLSTEAGRSCIRKSGYVAVEP